MARDDKAELGYIAAVLDAEGTLSIGSKNKGSSYQAVVAVSQANWEWLSGMQKLWGGAVYPNPDNRPGYALMWRWCVRGDDMVGLLKVVRPYLRLKREQANLLIELESRVHSFPRKMGSPLTSEELQVRRGLWMQCRLLNKKGPRANQLKLPTPSPQLSLLVGARRV